MCDDRIKWQKGGGVIQAPTEEERNKLRGIAATRVQATALICAVVPGLLVVSRFISNDTLKLFVAMSAVVIGLAALIYMAFCLRCPRCKGWIAIPKCPSCGIALDRPDNSRVQMSQQDQPDKGDGK